MFKIDIIKHPNPLLRTVATRIEEVTPYLPLLLEMKEYIEMTPNAVGLAFPQVGVSKRAFVVKLEGQAEIVINPIILRKSFLKVSLSEGERCLSIPDESVEVKRRYAIKVRYTTLEGETQTKTLKAFHSILFQHEFDHLNGKLITDYK